MRQLDESISVSQRKSSPLVRKTPVRNGSKSSLKSKSKSSRSRSKSDQKVPTEEEPSFTIQTMLDKYQARYEAQLKAQRKPEPVDSPLRFSKNSVSPSTVKYRNSTFQADKSHLNSTKGNVLDDSSASQISPLRDKQKQELANRKQMVKQHVENFKKQVKPKSIGNQENKSNNYPLQMPAD
jgi:hypothetical protein